MLRICLKCGAFSADDSLGFCLADGTPLVRVIPNTERWTKGTRLLEEAGRIQKKQQRRLKWRRGMARAISTLVITTVVCVVAVNSFIYLKPHPDDDRVSSTLVGAEELTPPDRSITGGLTSEPAASPSPTLEGHLLLSPTPTPTPTPIPTPTPNPVYKISGRVMSLAGPLSKIRISLEGPTASSSTTDANGYYAFGNLVAGTSYTITPLNQLRIAPTHHYFENLRRDESADFFQTGATPTPTPTPTPSPGPSPSPSITTTWIPGPSPEIKEKKPECSEADKDRERQRILQTFGSSFRSGIEGEAQVEISLVGGCKNAVVKVRYSETRDNTNYPGVTTSRKEKRFGCSKKFLGQWFCAQI